MSAHPVSERRRGWCPGVRRPMETGDGLLVRIHPFAGRLTADQARLVAEAAREFGNGHLDITGSNYNYSTNYYTNYYGYAHDIETLTGGAQSDILRGLGGKGTSSEFPRAPSRRRMF